MQAISHCQPDPCSGAGNIKKHLIDPVEAQTDEVCGLDKRLLSDGDIFESTRWKIGELEMFDCHTLNFSSAVSAGATIACPLMAGLMH